MEYYTGRRFTVEVTRDGDASFAEAIAHAEQSCIQNLNARIERFADHGKLHVPQQLNDEGDGFYAIKARCGLRAYFWYHGTRRRVMVISHFAYKNYQKLRSQDKTRMQRNRQEYKEKSNE